MQDEGEIENLSRSVFCFCNMGEGMRFTKENTVFFSKRTSRTYRLSRSFIRGSCVARLVMVMALMMLLMMMVHAVPHACTLRQRTADYHGHCRDQDQLH